MNKKSTEIINKTTVSDLDMIEPCKLERKTVDEFFKKQRQYHANKYCYDCNSSSAIWVSLTYSIFLCSNCAGKHRSYGVDISRVMSSINDKWDLNNLRRVFVGTNVRAAEEGLSKDYLGASKSYIAFLNNLVSESLVEFPDDSFLKVEIKKPEFHEDAVKSYSVKVEEKSVPKIGAIYVEPISPPHLKENKTKVEVKKKKEKVMVVEPVKKYTVKTNTYASLETNHEKRYIADNSLDVTRLGLIGQSITETTTNNTNSKNESKFSYKNINGIQTRNYSEKQSIGRKAKEVASNISEKGRNVINNLISKFKK